MSSVPVGIIGFGKLGTLHAGTIVEYPASELVAVYDSDPDALDLARSYGALVYDDIDKFLRLPTEAVVITSSTSSHAEHICAVARSGKAIFTEKPVGLTLEATDAALQEVVDRDIPFQIGFQRRWDSRYIEAKAIIDSGYIGNPVLFKAYGRDPNASNPANWGLDKNGGIFLNCAIHDFDAARYLLGQEIVAVSATGGALVHKGLERVGDIDTASTSLFFSGGAMAVTEWSRYASYGYDIGMEVVCTKGIVQLPKHPRAFGLDVQGATSGGPTVFSVFGGAFKSSIEGFIDAIASGSAPSPGVQDARVSLQVALAARASFQHEGWITNVQPLPELQRIS